VTSDVTRYSHIWEWRYLLHHSARFSASSRRESAPLVLLVRAEALCPSPIFARTFNGKALRPIRMLIYIGRCGTLPRYEYSQKRIVSLDDL